MAAARRPSERHEDENIPSGAPNIRSVQPYASGAINGNSTATTALSVPGAELGQVPCVSFDNGSALGPVIVARAWVESPNVVNVTFYNTFSGPFTPNVNFIIELLPLD